MSAPSQTANTQPATAPHSENALTSGLFTAGDFIRPNERQSYADLQAELLRDLVPVGILETTLVDEIRRATWRLRRCGQVEANLVIGLDDGKGFIFDPMESANTDIERVQKSVDRARAQAHRLLHKCTAELRKLQTERHFRNEFFDAETDISHLGISDVQSIRKGLDNHVAAQYCREKPIGPPVGSFCKTPRNAQRSLPQAA